MWYSSTIIYLDLRRIGRIEAEGLSVKTMPRVDLEQGCGRNGGTRKFDLLAKDDPAPS